jgi:hypothetical protein
MAASYHISLLITRKIIEIKWGLSWFKEFRELRAAEEEMVACRYKRDYCK